MRYAISWIAVWLSIATALGQGRLDPALQSADATSTQSPAQNSGKIFDFHSGFWINLHHFMYWQSLSITPRQAVRAQTLDEADDAEFKALTPEERISWDTAVSYYASSVIQRDLLFDEGMAAIKNKLEDSESSSDLTGVEIATELRTVLQRAAPIYRKHWWPRHDAQNRQWIGHVQPLIAEHGETLRSSLVTIYAAAWPQQPVRIDTVAYANWAGAYTTIEPTRPTISTTDRANQGPSALEIIFHESSHGMMDAVINALTSSEKANASRSNATVHFRRDLWHEVLFYTTGELVAERIPGYVPYADKNGLWTRAWPGPDRMLIEQDWKPHIEGTVGLQPALAKLVNDLASAGEHN
jgi:hypothetical protein